MKVSVIGGTGSVGANAVKSLKASGVDCNCIVRRQSRFFQSADQGTFSIADLDAADSLAPALSGTDTLLLISPMHPDEARRGLAAVAAAARAGVRKIVYQSVLRRPGMDDILHYRSKLPVEDAILSAGFDSVIYRPNSFHQNDNFLRASIQAGVYPQPVGGVGVNRLDVADIGSAAAAAVMDPTRGHVDVELHGPEAITGDRTAEIFAAALGHPVRYGGDDVDAWAARSQGVMADWMVEALAQMYRHFQLHGMQPLNPAERTTLLPSNMITTEDYARSKAIEWTALATA